MTFKKLEKKADSTNMLTRVSVSSRLLNLIGGAASIRRGLSRWPAEVTIVEVGPRDGLQNEKQQVPTDKKIEFVDRLASTGLKRIEVTSFVSPKWVPQLADAKIVMQQIKRNPTVRYSTLTPNLKGYKDAVSLIKFLFQKIFHLIFTIRINNEKQNLE